MRLTLTNFEIRKDWYEINNTNSTFFIADNITNNIYPVLIPPGSYRMFAPNGVNGANGGNPALNANVIGVVATSSITVLNTPVAAVNTPYGYNTLDLASAIKYAIDKTLYVVQNGGTITDWNGNAVNGVVYAATNYFGAGVVSPSCTVKWNTITRKYVISYPAFVAGLNNPIAGCFSLQLKSGFGQFLANNGFAAFAAAALNQSTNNNKALYGDWTFQDTHEIIGGRPTRDTSTGFTQIGLTVATNLNNGLTTANTILTMSLPYPAQLNSVEAIYLRMYSSSTNNYQAPALEKDLPNTGVLNPTNIFARFPLPAALYDDANEIISFSDTGAYQYQSLLDTHQLDTLHIAITDDKNRPISEVSVGEAADGALSFKLTFKWELIQIDESLNVAPPSLDVITSLNPVGFVRPTALMQSTSSIPTLAPQAKESKFTSKHGQRANP